MWKSLLFTTLMGLMGLNYAVPTVSIGNKLAQMEEMKVAVDAFVQNFPQELYEELRRNVTAPANNNAACARATLIFARGTFEPAGTANLGSMVGMPFLSALKSAVPGIDGIGVDYNNGVIGYLVGGDPTGGKTMGKMIQDKARECPNTKIVASGYRYVYQVHFRKHWLTLYDSQGAQVAHLALDPLSNDVKSHVSGVVRATSYNGVCA
jgi:cutinase